MITHPNEEGVYLVEFGQREAVTATVTKTLRINGDTTRPVPTDYGFVLHRINGGQEAPIQLNLLDLREMVTVLDNLYLQDGADKI